MSAAACGQWLQGAEGSGSLPVPVKPASLALAQRQGPTCAPAPPSALHPGWVQTLGRAGLRHSPAPE